MALWQVNLDTIYRAFTAQYGFQVKVQYTVDDLEGKFLVLPVRIFAVNILNACISCASLDGDDNPVNATEKQINKASMLFSGAFQTVETSVGISTPPSTMYHLSKSNS